MTFHGDTAARRKAQLATAHVVVARLGLDTDTYRALLERLTGKRSMAKMDFRERVCVLDELRRLSGNTGRRLRGTVPPPGAPTGVREELAAMIAKLEAMAAELGYSWAYIDGMAKRMFHVDRAQWCTAQQLHKLVAALSFHQRRKRGKA